MNKLMFASVISEIQQSDVFMTVKARICETPAANLNGARVTEKFIDEIVGNEKRYVGLPLYADVKALISGNYNRLGHLYDSRTGEFHSTQIGSFYKFEKEDFENGSYLVGYARIPKRNKKLSKAITELFADNALKFSFELAVGEYEELDDDTILIDASENNYIEGTAIVTFPACEDAVALELVAQKADDAKGGEDEMAEVQNPAEEVVEETNTEANDNVIASEEPEEAQEQTSETAAVVTTQRHEESVSTFAYDTETGKEVSQTVSVETVTRDYQEGQLVETTDGVHVAESENKTIAEGETTNEPTEEPAEEPAKDPVEDPTEETEEEAEEEPVTDSVDSKKKTAEVAEEAQENPGKSSEQMIAELLEAVNSLKNEIAEMKAKKAVTAEINPFMSDINAKGKYTLLEKASPTDRTYSLLDKA